MPLESSDAALLVDMSVSFALFAVFQEAGCGQDQNNIGA